MILEDCSVTFYSLNLCSLNLYVTNKVPVLEVALLVPNFFQGVINI